MLRIALLLAWPIALLLVLAAPACADDYDAIQACPVPPASLELGATERSSWNDCEKWVWSCVVDGLEANLFARECVVPRQSKARRLRDESRLEPFTDPWRFERRNGIRESFVADLLQKDAHASRILASGVRIVGAYFAGPLNL